MVDTDPARARASLAHELTVVARAIESLRAGHRLDESLIRLQIRLPAASVGPVRDMAFECTRQLGLCEALARVLNLRAPEAALAALQLVVLAQLIEPIRHPGVIVDQAVQAARLDARLRDAAGFLNATLRRFVRERVALLERVRQAPEALWNHPGWWIDRLRTDHPKHWERVLEESNRHPPFTLRVNLRRISVDAYQASLLAAGFSFRRVGEAALIVQPACPVETLPGWADGWVSVQDSGAQWAAPALAVRPGERVLDACAAPGGKTAHVLERVDCQLTALDVNPARLQRVQSNLARLGLSARCLVGDACEPHTWWDGERYDRILVDAPCSASGIVRRSPDARWLRRRSDLATLARQQGRILDALWPLLAPGGTLLYVTCSVFHAEGSEVAERFLKRTGDASARPISGWPPVAGAACGVQRLPRSGHEDDHDGFYYCLFEKRS